MSRLRRPALYFCQAEDGIRYADVTGVQTCALPISSPSASDTSLPRGSTPISPISTSSRTTAAAACSPKLWATPGSTASTHTWWASGWPTPSDRETERHASDHTRLRCGSSRPPAGGGGLQQRRTLPPGGRDAHRPAVRELRVDGHDDHGRVAVGRDQRQHAAPVVRRAARATDADPVLRAPDEPARLSAASRQYLSRRRDPRPDVRKPAPRREHVRRHLLRSAQDAAGPAPLHQQRGGAWRVPRGPPRQRREPHPPPPLPPGRSDPEPGNAAREPPLPQPGAREH